jgi:tetratricopeptide (TPR) repeat protein
MPTFYRHDQWPFFKNGRSRRCGAAVGWLATLLVVLVLAPSAQAQTPPKRYCTPEAYTREQIDTSMKVCDEMIADPRQTVGSRIQAYANRGSMFKARKQYDASLQNYNQAIALVATVKVVTSIGFSTKIPPGAIDNIAASSVYEGRARLYAVQKQYARAIEDYTKTLQILPSSGGTLFSRAEAYEALGQYDRAIQDLDQALVDIPNNIGIRGRVYLKKRDYDRALSDLNKALEVNASDQTALAGRGVVYLAKGDVDRALLDLDKAIEGRKTVSSFRNSRGLAYRKKGDVDRALEDFDDAVKYANSDDDNRAEYLVNRADTWKDKGDWLKALEDYQSALTINSSQSGATAGRDAARLALSRPAPVAAAVVSTAAIAAPAAKMPPINERRVALVIGNSSYLSVAALPNPRRDAETLALALRAAGFQTVQIAADLSREGFAKQLQSFAAEADRADWAVVYFAGHGIEVGGVNYLIPIDARLKTDRDVPLEAVALDQVLATVSGAKKLRLVVLDACRDNPFVAKMSRTVAGRSIGRGLASIEPEGGTLVAFAAKHGQTALDGAQGGNSPFVAAFVKHLQSPNIEISKMFRLVRDDVLAATGKQQEPFTYGSLPGQDFFFKVQ